MLFPGRFVADEEGQTMAEYGLILALISVAAVAVMITLGGQIGATFTDIRVKMGGTP
jgi:pilus assembly protein Flp/PilA